MNKSTSLKLSKKNFLLWRLMTIEQLINKKWFNLVNEEKRERSSFNYYNNHRSSLRERKKDCLEYLFSNVDIEIYEEIKHFNEPFHVWSFLQAKYSKPSIKRLSTSMKELQRIRFNLGNFNQFIDKFKKAIKKINECGLQLEDSYLNLYLLSGLEKSKRVENASELHQFFDCKFDDFLIKIKDKIIQASSNPDIEYSDISNESISFDDEDDNLEFNNQNLNFQLTNLTDLNSKINKNLQQFGLAADVEDKQHNEDDRKMDYKIDFNLKPPNEFDELVKKYENEEESRNKVARNAFSCDFLSPIKNYSQLKQVNLDNDQIEIEPSTSKVYEDLKSDLNLATVINYVPNCSSKGLFFTVNNDNSSVNQSDKQQLDSAINKESGDRLESNETNDNYQLKDDQTENVNLPDYKIVTNSDYFFIDKNGQIIN